VDWCEVNYVWSYYIAEFFNTITSLPAAVLALNSMYLTYKYGYGKRFFVVNLMIVMVGLGSAAFHGTLLYTGQILDELPMVYASLSLLYATLEMEADKKPVYKYSASGLTAFAMVFTGVYLYLPDFFIFFVVAYILCILTLVYHVFKICQKPTALRHQKLFALGATASYIGGWLFFWIPEVLFCEKLQAFNFHAMWHATSTFGAFFFVIFAVYERERARGRRPQICYNTFAGVSLLPYIHVPSAKEIQVMDKEEFKRKEAEDLQQEEIGVENRKYKIKRSSVSNSYLAR